MRSPDQNGCKTMHAYQGNMRCRENFLFIVHQAWILAEFLVAHLAD